MAYHKEHLPQVVSELIQRMSVEHCLLFCGAGKVANENQETGI